MPLKNLKIVGFFSLPAASLQEANPEAYRLAMSDLPAGAGACSHCGTGIIHHVVVQEPDGSRRFIGQDCAGKIGLDRDQVRFRLTDEQREERESARAARVEETRRTLAEYEAREAARLTTRWSRVGHVVSQLQGLGGEFNLSLADQLKSGPLSLRQAHFVVKNLSSTGRRNKANGEWWDALLDLCTSPEE